VPGPQTTNFDSPSDSSGPVERKVRADIGASISGHPMGEALSELAFTLARTLDEGAGMATAAVSRELRAALADLTLMIPDGDDDLDAQLSTPSLPATVWDQEEP